MYGRNHIKYATYYQFIIVKAQGSELVKKLEYHKRVATKRKLPNDKLHNKTAAKFGEPNDNLCNFRDALVVVLSGVHSPF